MKPNFLILGAMRCGTTFLASSLSKHPQVFLSTPKEPNYFNDDRNYAKGPNWYRAHYAQAGDAIAIGEASTRYSKATIFPQTASRIYADLPGAKLIYIVRDPFERLESHWLHYRRWGRQALSFEKALGQHPQWIETSCYWLQIQTYRSHFPDDRILVLFLEEMRRDPARTVSDCLRFLGVDVAASPSQFDSVRNESEGRMVERGALRAARRSQSLRALGTLAPTWLKTAARPLLTRRIQGRPVWSSELREEVGSRVLEDSRTFLRFYGKPETLWNLGTEGS